MDKKQSHVDTETAGYLCYLHSRQRLSGRRLMADMHESTPMKMHYPVLARRCLDLKTDDK
jgi:hypothetical protein